jgi:hypothetical protein
MARYNEILVGRINRGLQKYFGIKGDAPVPQLAGDVSVGHVLFNGVENRYLEGWESFGFLQSQGAVAASSGAIRLRNPTGSGVVAVIYKLSGHGDGLSNGTLSVEQLQTNPPDLANIRDLNVTNFDVRGRPRPTCIASFASPGASMTQLGDAQIVTSSTYDFIVDESQEIPLLPGTAVQLRMIDVNKAMSATIWFRERFLEESERS